MTAILRPTIQKAFQLYRKQQNFVTSPALYRGFVGGRGSGKSKAGAFDLATKAKSGHAHLVGSPTAIKLRDETFPTFKAVCEQLGIWKPRWVKLTPYPTATLSTGAEIRFRTLDNPENARGPNLLRAWLDEGSLMPRPAFTVVIGCLRDGMNMGGLTVTFTPKGRRHWTYLELGTGKPNTAIFRAATSENPFIPAEFAHALRSAYTRAEAEQEIEGQFLDAGDEFQVIPEEWVRAAMARWTPEGFAGRKLSCVGADVAMGGDCNTVAAPRRGSWFGKLVVVPGRLTPDGDSAAAVFREVVRGEEQALINVDTFGVGAECYGSLCRLGLNCAAINVGTATNATDRSGTLTFANLRAFGYWSLRELLDPKNKLPNDPPPMLPPDDELLDELIEHRWKPVGCQVSLEKKEDIAKRLGRSPDKADALMLSILIPMVAA